jgi:3',5'-cyclic AMP phosphodiesterase CpdA
VPAGDVLVHCGDFTHKGTAAETAAFDAYLGALPHKHKLLVGGNHDCGVFAEFRPEMIQNARYLDNAGVTIEGVRFYGR